MNIIKCVSWKSCELLWTEWKNFKSEENFKPQKLNTAQLYIDSQCLSGVTRRRTFGFIKETPGDPTTTDNTLGFAMVKATEVSNLKIGHIKMAIDPNYQGNNVEGRLMEVCLSYMFQAQFDISLLQTPFPEFYENFGYVTLQDNIMYRSIKGLPLGWTKNMLINLLA